MRNRKFIGLCLIAIVCFVFFFNWKILSKLKILELEYVDNEQWVILLAVNFAYIDLFQNWLWYYEWHKLGIPVIVIAEDEKCFQNLTSIYKDNVMAVSIKRSGINNTEHAADFASRSFNKLVAARPVHIMRYLQGGKNVVYCDADSVWLQNPFKHFVGDFDIWAQIDGNEFCTGFLAIQTNTRTNKFVTDWKLYMDKKGLEINDQMGFNELDKSTLRIKGLDTNLFPDGYRYFNELDAKRRSHVIVVHNNFIVGHDRKIERFKRYNQWRNP